MKLVTSQNVICPYEHYYDGSKEVNRIQSGSFQDRCYAAGLRVQNGPGWLSRTLSDITNTEPEKVLKYM